MEPKDTEKKSNETVPENPVEIIFIDQSNSVYDWTGGTNFLNNLIDEKGNKISVISLKDDDNLIGPINADGYSYLVDPSDVDEDRNLIDPIDVDDDGNPIDPSDVDDYAKHYARINVQENQDQVPMEKKTYKKYDWKREERTLKLSLEDVNHIFNSKTRKFITSTYVKFFGKKLNANYPNISCVIRSNGVDFSKKKNPVTFVSLRFSCMHNECTREYKLQSISWGPTYEFAVNLDGIIKHNVRGITQELSGNERINVRNDLAHMTSKQFRSKKMKEADKDLRALGNLQEVYSESTLRRVRSEALSMQDLHQNDIQDLFESHKKQISEVNNKVEGAELFIQHVNAVPFYVFALSDEQIKVLLKMVSEGDIVVLYVDATGCVVAAPQGVTKRIYYYAALLSLRVWDEIQAILFPLLEMVSASHDAFTIGTWLRHFRYVLSTVTGKWPIINHLVTDFSYAILNAASDAMNRETLIEHINNTYHRIIAGGSLEGALVVFLHICCNHFSKTAAKDINVFFPKGDSSTKVRTLVKEIIAAMFNMSDMDILAAVYKNLYILLTSKFVNEKVTSALHELTNLITVKSTETEEEEANNETDDKTEEILTYDETITYESIYESSLFYQHFKRLNIIEDFTVTNSLNQFYSPNFADLFLKKYITILPLWTRINNGNRVDNCKPEVIRFSNSYIENYFKHLKKKLRMLAPELGEMPLKSGRFLTHTRSYIHEVTEEYIYAFPKSRCCRTTEITRTPRTPSTLTTPKTSRKSASQLTLPSTPKRRPSTPKHNAMFLKEINVTPKTSRKRSGHVIPTSTPKRRCVTPSSKEINVTPKTTRKRSGHVISTSTPKRRCVTPSSKENKDPFSTPLSSKRRQSTPSSALLDNDKILSNIRKSHQSNRRLLITNQSDDDILIDNPFAEETWKPKSIKHSYFQGNALRSLASPKNLERILCQSDKEVESDRKLPNHLTDNPNLYMLPTTPFAVASFKKYVLYNLDYKTLSENNRLSNFLMEFIGLMFGSERKDIQIETLRTKQLVEDTFSQKILKIEANNFMGVLDNQHYTLVIVNLTKKVFSYIDPYSHESPNEGKFYRNFQKFLEKHNAVHTMNNIETEGWVLKNYNHPLQDSQNVTDGGVFVLKYIRDLINNNRIQNDDFDISGFRKYLAHYILQHSKNMKGRCIVCGFIDDLNTVNESLDASLINESLDASLIDEKINWTRCDICKRWCHDNCTIISNKKSVFLCVVCKSK